ncbi:MAG: peptidoglycan synthetase [Bacteroidetes bacterium]|nr:peptidoglycan synthetase [Bacteroidota bacterium]
MRIHLIAIGGSVMHNLAIALSNNHHSVTGSDDEIYNPSRNRLQKNSLLPQQMGWQTNNITKDIDLVILGMHARPDNPELKKANALDIPVVSYPEFIAGQSRNKKRIVIAGSHGKTTTTSMVMHVLQYSKVDFDYLVGAQLEGFENMVQLSDAPVIVMEGDEYLSSPIDRRPKFLHYKPDIAVLTGIAWDHMNVFPTFQSYLDSFEIFLQTISNDGVLFYDERDEHVNALLSDDTSQRKYRQIGYSPFNFIKKDGHTFLIANDEKVELQVFGEHNLANLHAAYHVCRELGVGEEVFINAISTFKGAAKRLQLLRKKGTFEAFFDFAHAPSKVKATVKAVKNQYLERSLVACVELHTFSSLNKEFIHNYKHTMEFADKAVVYFSEHTLQMKKLPPISKKDISDAFDHPDIQVFTRNEEMKNYLNSMEWKQKTLLFMTSGNFNGLNLKEFVEELINE